MAVATGGSATQRYTASDLEPVFFEDLPLGAEWTTRAGRADRAARIEHGRMSPTVALLEKLAAALNISVRELFPVERRRRHPKGGVLHE